MKFGAFQSLAAKKEISFLNSRGVFLKSKSFNAKIIEEAQNKALFIIRKKIGNAPIRNKIKRQLRAILAIQNNLLPKQIHIMIIVKNEFLSSTFLQTKNEVEHMLNQVHKKFFQ